MTPLPHPVLSDEDVTIYQGDCRELLPYFYENGVDSVVTDPPYDLTAGKKGGTGLATRNLDNPYGRARIGAANGGFMGKDWDATGIAFDPALWAEVLRVLRPGGHLLAFGGSRTYHRLACAIEDAGFEIRDSIHWTFGSGFPKSMNVGEGRGTALKPSHEPIVLARKPFPGTVAANLAAHGTGALNIDDCRVGNEQRTNNAGSASSLHRVSRVQQGYRQNLTTSVGENSTVVGRWPANTVLTHSATCVQVGERVLRGDQREGGTGTREPGFGDVRGRTDGNGEPAGPVYGDEVVPVFECAPDCPVAELDRQSGLLTSGKMQPTHTVAGRSVFGQNAAGGYTTMETYGDSGGASRFFPVFRYEAKAPQYERPQVGGVSHPTVKPLELMRWLVRLVTPPGGTVLDPFLGSGTTAEAAIREGRHCAGIELTPDYVPLIRARLAKPMQTALEL